MVSAISLALAAIAFCLSLITALLLARIAVRVRELLDRCAALSNSSPALLTKRVESLETMLQDQGTALNEVAQKMKMQKVRAAANHVPDKETMPDPYRDPDAWRKAMNAKLKLG